MFRCPHTPAHLKYSYGFNANLSGVSDNDYTDPAHTVLLYEAASGQPNAHDDPSRLRSINWDGQYVHGQSSRWANFVFADGHVQAIGMWRYEEQLDNGEIRVKP